MLTRKTLHQDLFILKTHIFVIYTACAKHLIWHILQNGELFGKAQQSGGGRKARGALKWTRWKEEEKHTMADSEQGTDRQRGQNMTVRLHLERQKQTTKQGRRQRKI